MLDATDYDLFTAARELAALRRAEAHAMMRERMAYGEDFTADGFRRAGFAHARNDDALREALRQRSIDAAAILQEVGEMEEEFDLPRRAGDALY